MRTVKIPWYENPKNLEILLKEALFSVPSYWVRIYFTDSVPTGCFCWHKSTEFIQVNPLPKYAVVEGKEKVKKPYCLTRNGQWNLTRAILRHELRHFLLTTRYTVKLGSALQYLVNALEDGRIEAWQDLSDPEAADLFRHAGNAMWRVGWKDLKASAPTTAKEDVLLSACLFWRWGFTRVSHRHFRKTLFGHDEALFPIWEAVKVEVEAAWRAADTTTVQAHAERILDIIGVKADAPYEGSNGLGELSGDGSAEPETPRAAGRGSPLPGDEGAEEPDDVSEGEEDEKAGRDAGSETRDGDEPERDTDELTGDEADLSDETIPGGSPMACPLIDDPEVDYDEHSLMEPVGYAALVEEASPLAERMLRLPATRERHMAHPERGAYSLRREWHDADRPNDYLIQARGGKKRAICCIIDVSGSNDHRAPWIRQALMALHLAAIRDGHNLSILACGQVSKPHYAVIQEHNCRDLDSAKARIAGLEFPHDSEYVGAALEAAGAALRAQREALKEILLLSDADLVVPNDTLRAQRYIRALPRGIRLTGMLLVGDSAHLRSDDLEYKALMESLLQGCGLAVCTAQEMPEALNAILVH